MVQKLIRAIKILHVEKNIAHLNLTSSSISIEILNEREVNVFLSDFDSAEIKVEKETWEQSLKYKTAKEGFYTPEMTEITSNNNAHWVESYYQTDIFMLGLLIFEIFVGTSFWEILF